MINRNEYINNYKKQNYHRITIEVSKDHYADIKEHSSSRGESVNGFIKRAIKQTIASDKQDSST